MKQLIREILLVSLGVTAAVSIGSAILLYFFLGCCTSTVSLRIVNNGPEAPILDLTYRGGPSHQAAEFYSLEIWQLDKNGVKTKCLWATDCASSGNIYPKLVQYGKPPAGWTERIKAAPFENGGIYYLVGGKVFIKEKNGSYTVLEDRYFSPSEIAKALKKHGEPLAEVKP